MDNLSVDGGPQVRKRQARLASRKSNVDIIGKYIRTKSTGFFRYISGGATLTALFRKGDVASPARSFTTTNKRYNGYPFKALAVGYSEPFYDSTQFRNNWSIMALFSIDSTTGNKKIYRGNKEVLGFAWTSISGDEELYVASDKVTFKHHYGSGGNSYYSFPQSTASLKPRLLYLVVVTRDGPSLKMYINGVLDSTHTLEMSTARTIENGAVVGSETNPGNGWQTYSFFDVSGGINLYKASYEAVTYTADFVKNLMRVSFCEGTEVLRGPKQRFRSRPPPDYYLDIDKLYGDDVIPNTSTPITSESPFPGDLGKATSFVTMVTMGNTTLYPTQGGSQTNPLSANFIIELDFIMHSDYQGLRRIVCISGRGGTYAWGELFTIEANAAGQVKARWGNGSSTPPATESPLSTITIPYDEPVSFVVMMTNVGESEGSSSGHVETIVGINGVFETLTNSLTDSIASYRSSLEGWGLSLGGVLTGGSGGWIEGWTKTTGSDCRTTYRNLAIYKHGADQVDWYVTNNARNRIRPVMMRDAIASIPSCIFHIAGIEQTAAANHLSGYNFGIYPSTNLSYELDAMGPYNNGVEANRVIHSRLRSSPLLDDGGVALKFIWPGRPNALAMNTYKSNLKSLRPNFDKKNFTFLTWFNVDSSTNFWHGLLKVSYSNYQILEIRLHSSGYVYVYWAGHNIYRAGPSAYLADTTNFLAVRQNGSGTLEVYIGSTLLTPTLYDESIAAAYDSVQGPMPHLTLGYYNYNFDSGFSSDQGAMQGKLQYPSLFNSCLTLEEISAIRAFGELDPSIPFNSSLA